MTLGRIPNGNVESNDKGSSICSNEEQSLNALSPIDTTEEGIDSCTIDEQPSKAEPPIEVTEYGIEICFNEVHIANAQ